MLSAVYGSLVCDRHPEAAIRNLWVREIISNERELQYYKTQAIISGLVSVVTMKPEIAIETNKRYLNHMYPWNEELKAQEAGDLDKTREDAIKKYQADKLSGNIEAARKAIAAEESSKRWVDPIQEETAREEQQANKGL